MGLAAVGAALSIGSSLLGIGSSVLGMKSERDANKRAREAARAQANLTYQTRQEEMRRTRREADQVVGFNRAAIGASNLLFSGSSRNVLRDVQDEFNRDLDWRRRAAEKEKRAIAMGAPGSSADMAALGRGFAGIASHGVSIGRTLIDYNS